MRAGLIVPLAVVACLAIAIVVWVTMLPRAIAVQSGDSQPAPSVEVTPAPGPGTAAPGVQVDPSWLASTASATGIPRRVLEGYALAVLDVQTSTPGCHISWNTVAAIGYVESANGTLGGAHVDEVSGRLVGTILGPVLDGRRFDAVHDTDKGVLDGNATWDRAVGPMQFLPSEWATHGRDGNGDGVRDPNQIDDASLATADYLCAAGGDLATGAGWTRAVTAYNHDASYVKRVRDAADGYARDVAG